ncbi:MAG: Ni/Fe hydrogenase subunit alpha [Halothiobacillus sp. 24-54-40]|jgi:coenzyme F420-reducing hydrogenase alpha subunit|nr:MAG: Ni/Fe hydrogenase subunit alpha [Halothiobacillus sp. 35-54-62]OYZ87719.1 MAG: Ni/Fe hydrogenase subunit alpha [Halothiobacillus sp. 24-54-40]OZA81502.1 MAG: Ni/Fe hydrogenase subunit alpha [Halothiobacillus sp. 39-53-45]HQS02796.1 Ni/Fe hydrogenase subunit alpha [Halothiobacillus sp.]
MSDLRTGEIHVPILARVEGEGALDIRIRDGHIDELHLRIFEPPRLFEKLLEGRPVQDVIDSVARICGICPVAYQMSAVAAIESIFNFTPTPWVQAMRRVMYCGEWIQSHSLHVHLLAAPDFLGFNSAPAMAKQFPLEVRRGLRLQGIGNDIIRTFGGRSVHPVGVRPGGFFRAPDAAAMATLRQKIHESLNEARDLIVWVATLPIPEDDQDFTSVSLRQNGEYPITGGRIVSDRGLDIAIEEYEQHFREFQVPYSTALHALLDDQPYLVGPLARLNNNYAYLPADLRQLIEATGIRFPSRNMFHSILARAIEIYYALSESLRLTENYDARTTPYVEPVQCAGIGYGCTEAPRGILWHRYALDEQGHVLNAQIVPPTSQNQARMEEDLKTSLTRFGLDQPDDALRLHGEMVIRNYDPCISCATHFLDFRAARQ